jgi:hypothetical protein
MATVSFSTAFITDVMERLTLTDNTGERRDVLSSAVGNYARVEYQSSSAISNPHTISSDSSLGGIFADLPPTLTFNQNRSDILGGNGALYIAPTPISASIFFRNSSGTTLTSYLASELTRTIDANGYCVLSNFPPKTPVVAGTISDIYFRTDTGAFRTITLTVGAPDSSADVQFDDRVLVTNQPWRLDGSIKFRVPISYEYST